MFWSYLWGIEINSKKEGLWRYDYVLILPMRDWNTIHRHESARSITSFWSYLWGIEIWRNAANHSHEPRFDLTYEGLKFSSISISLNCFWVLILPMRDWNFFDVNLSVLLNYRFDLTYEGLKFAWSVDNNFETESFDLTYEGLKYNSPSKIVICIFSFWSYLWGIEILETPRR